MTKLVFSEVEPKQIDGLWPYLIPAIDEYQQRFGKEIDWTQTDVLQALKADTGRIVFVYQKGLRIGFMIVRGFQGEFKKQKYMHIWLGYLYPEYRGHIREYLPQAFDYLAKMAVKGGAQYIEMDTPRPGWKRLMSQIGMNLQRTVYRKEI
jgi:hypothetical protein